MMGEISDMNISPIAQREMAIEYAKHYIGTWYSWGGDSPDGFDCSGFCVEIGKAVGLFPRRKSFDLGSKDVYTFFEAKDVAVDVIRKGMFVFYTRADGLVEASNIIHVEFALDNYFSIGASGGGSKTLSKADAIRDKAFIKVRPLHSRANLNFAVDPFREDY